MESLLGSFSIGSLLRNVFSGAFFVISYYIASQGLLGLADMDDARILSVGLPIALIAGVITYSLHRSLFYPVIERCMVRKWVTDLRKRRSFLTDEVIKITLFRWKQRCTKDASEDEIIAKQFDGWADYIHLQHTSALCIVIGSLVGIWISPGNQVACWPLISFAALLSVAAIMSDWRLRLILDHLMEEHNKSCRDIAEGQSYI